MKKSQAEAILRPCQGNFYHTPGSALVFQVDARIKMAEQTHRKKLSHFSC